MKQMLWNTYHFYVKSKYIFQIYRKRANIIDKTLTIILAVVSSAGVASWAIWNQWAVVWAIIIGASNIANIIKSHLPYEKRIYAMDYMLPKLINLIAEIESYYRRIALKKEEDIDKDEVNNKIEILDKVYNDLCNTFAIKNIPEPWSKKISIQAENLAKEEVNRNYDFIAK